MGRSESSKTNAQSLANSKQDQANAQSALSSTNRNLGQYNEQLQRAIALGRGAYAPGGDYMQANNAINTAKAGAAANKLQGDMATHAMQTGENTAGYAPALAEEERAGQRDTAEAMAQAEADRIQKQLSNEYFGVGAAGLPAQVQAGLYGTSISGATGQMGAAAESARTPGFWDTFLPALAGAGGQVAAGFTPKGGGSSSACWIAEAIWGEADYRTHLVRAWLNTDYQRSSVGRVVMALYRRFGQRVARMVRKYAMVKRTLTPLFERALERAQAWKDGRHGV